MFDWLSDYIEPIQEIEVNFKSGKSKTLKSTDIQCIKQLSDRNYKEIYCNFGIIKWKTRDSLLKIRNSLGNKLFIQISKQEIVRILSITGRDAQWKYISICTYTKNNYCIKELKVGREYMSSIKKHFRRLPSLKVKNPEGDVFLINPLDISHIIISRNRKQLHLIKPVYGCNKKLYVLEWNTLLSATKVIEHTRTDLFVQVNRYVLVNLTHIEMIDLANMKVIIKHRKEEVEITIGEKYRVNLE